jgi:hypothetical protein
MSGRIMVSNWSTVVHLEPQSRECLQYKQAGFFPVYNAFIPYDVQKRSWDLDKDFNTFWPDIVHFKKLTLVEEVFYVNFVEKT